MGELDYGFGKAVSGRFEDVVRKVTGALEKEGFGVLTEIDVAATLKKKLDQEMRPYRILGACNPPLASRAIDAEPSIGLLLPCNVVVRELKDGQVSVEAMDPVAVLELVGNENVREIAEEVRRRMERVIDAVS